MSSGFSWGFRSATWIRTPPCRSFDFKRDDHPFVPMYMFVDKKGTVRFQYTGKDDFFKNEEKNTRLLIEGLLKQ